MAEFSPSQDGLERSGGLPRVNLVNLAGAAISLALVVGIGVWGYRIVMRDVSGIPVVRALEGPMRVQPENPGGIAAENQGFAVNTVAASGIAEAPADRLVLAPMPEEIDAEEAAALRPVVPLPEGEDTRDIAAAAEGPFDAVAEEDLSEEEAILALADQIAAQVAGGVAEVNRETAERARPEVFSIRPLVRPERVTLARSAPAKITAPKEIDPATLAKGTALVQLGAYPSGEIARAEWVRIAGRFGELLGPRPRVIQRVETGGRIFYRLRASGFDDINDARRFCAALNAESADCIPVSVK
ncbi:Sporulation related domain-containing protein [Poseidonocella pacifica]|uniref:Sporulation related domain-containing protein n=1 Tax=Poseidonocella pacifica TaxID=871651 RepID=A0A1I0VKL4_9RHOB|nr:SPOR domain-containing protein [Poseidonocella pacifica]SFA76944.1 Sporulation related domain-containing protein [Poseidonocella pacifica]